MQDSAADSNQTSVLIRLNMENNVGKPANYNDSLIDKYIKPVASFITHA